MGEGRRCLPIVYSFITRSHYKPSLITTITITPPWPRTRTTIRTTTTHKITARPLHHPRVHICWGSRHPHHCRRCSRLGQAQGQDDRRTGSCRTCTRRLAGTIMGAAATVMRVIITITKSRSLRRPRCLLVRSRLIITDNSNGRLLRRMGVDRHLCTMLRRLPLQALVDPSMGLERSFFLSF
jgi:hypothetical protein